MGRIRRCASIACTGLVIARAAGALMADDIPVAHTPPGGYGKTFPPPVLANCTEPLVAGAPDLRGVWRTLRAERNGEPVPPDHPIWRYAERIEQCGNRIVDMGHGTIADARADGTRANAVDDLSAFDYESRVIAIASYEDGVFVLKPVLVHWLGLTLPFVRVRRWLDEDGHMVWTRPDLGGQKVVLERIGGPNDPYTIPEP